MTSPSMPRVYPLVPRRAEGCVIEDVDGNRFLDLNAGIAVTATGHCHPAVVAAIEEQAGRMLHYCSSDFYHPVYSELCQRLAALAPFGGAPARVFLGNSGTEAVEAAIKLARHHTGRAHLVAFLGGFHGRTMGSLSLTASKARYRTGFGPLLPGVQHVPYGMAGRLVFDEHHAVISALGARDRGPTTVYSAGATEIIAAMPPGGRLLVVSSAGLDIPSDAGPATRFLARALHRIMRDTYSDMARMEQLLAHSELRWTAIRPSPVDRRPCRK